jgi:aminoglycoside phosphotransferase (APT) family kinase protein
MRTGRESTVVTEVRVNPLLDVTREELVQIAGGPLVRIERIDGGLTNTIHRVVRASGEVLAIKHYAEGRDAFDAELVTLTLLHGTLPVPEVVTAAPEAPAIAYRWIDGITFNDCRRNEPPGAFASLADPLGRLLAWLARTDATEPFELAPILATAHAQLAEGRARTRLGPALADTIRRAFDTFAPRLAFGNVCLVHGDLGGRNLIVQRADRDRWRIGGVIDWEATSTGSPLLDLGSIFRYADRYDAKFRADFERGYREADGTLPDDWLNMSRLLDATWVVDMLDERRELPGVFADCRMLLTKLAADLSP